MIEYERYLSGAAEAMRGSAIRRMGLLSEQVPDLISFAPGHPDETMFAWNDFRDLAAELLNGCHGEALQYGPTRGYRPLLEALPPILQDRGIRAMHDELIVTSGSQQGLDLVARILLDPGDVALVELPTYTGAITAFRDSQAVLVGVKQVEDGIDLEDLDHVVCELRAAGRRVRFLYVVPNFQNPTGLMIGAQKRRDLLEWASRRDVLIAEDDPYGDLWFTEEAQRAARPIKADDTEGRVIYLSTFSKTLAPGFRVAWIAAPAPLIAKLELAKQAADLCTSSLDQRIVHGALVRGALPRDIPNLRAHYRDKLRVMGRALRHHVPDVVTWTEPQGGFFIWAALPDGLSTDRLLPHAIEEKVAYVPGAAFFVDGAGANWMRLAFSAPTADRIEEGVRRLARAIRRAI
jgi:2-aminoadipate transaminase